MGLRVHIALRNIPRSSTGILCLWNSLGNYNTPKCLFSFCLFCCFTQSCWWKNLNGSRRKYLTQWNFDFSKCIWFNNCNLPTEPVSFSSPPFSPTCGTCSPGLLVWLSFSWQEEVSRFWNYHIYFSFRNGKKVVCSRCFTHCWTMKAKQRPKIRTSLISVAEELFHPLERWQVKEE